MTYNSITKNNLLIHPAHMELTGIEDSRVHLITMKLVVIQKLKKQ